MYYCISIIVYLFLLHYMHTCYLFVCYFKMCYLQTVWRFQHENRWMFFFKDTIPSNNMTFSTWKPMNDIIFILFYFTVPNGIVGLHHGRSRSGILQSRVSEHAWSYSPVKTVGAPVVRGLPTIPERQNCVIYCVYFATLSVYDIEKHLFEF